MNQESLKSVLSYDPETGEFTWRVSPSRNVKAGMKAGSFNSQGYRQIQVMGRVYKAHRLAFLYMTGLFPEFTGSHKNGVPSDNRWDNLRDETIGDNIRNPITIANMVEASKLRMNKPGACDKQANRLRTTPIGFGNKSGSNLKWITDGIETKRILKSEPIPEGWRSGRTISKRL